MKEREISLKPSNFIDLTKGGENIGIFGISNKIGDSLVFSALPENYYLNTGKKLIDLARHRIFDKNPYVLRGISPSFSINLQAYMAFAENDIFANNSREDVEKLYNSFFSITDKINYFFGLNTLVRGPRLYYSDKENPIYADSFCVHSSGLSCGSLPMRVMDFIVNKYSNKTLTQVGGRDDIMLSVSNGLKIDCRGESFWDMVKTIYSCSVFIGPSSGPLHIANCFDHIRKKLILTNNVDQLLKMKPHSPFCGADYSVWTDYGWEYYNCYDYDIGITKSFLKL